MEEGSKSQPKAGSLPGWVNLLFFLFFGLLIEILPLFQPKTQDLEVFFVGKKIPLLAVFQENTLFPISQTFLPKEKPVRKIEVIVTAYSSTPWETDQTPYITASGTSVRNGIVAANFLPFGTKIKIPEIYGDEIFIVEDRMNPKVHYHVDVWFPSYWEALNFGAKRTYIEVLEG